MRRSRGLSAAAVVTLALGIGKNTAIFTVADALLFRPLPYRDPARLVEINAERHISRPRAKALIGRNRSFDGRLLWATMYLNVRTSRHRRRLVPALRRAVFPLDPDQPFTAVKTMDEVVAKAAGDSRFATTLLAGLAALAVVPAVIGISVAVSHAVADRTGELAVLIALAASRSDILTMALREGLTPAAIGLGVGAAAALALTRLISGMLYSVSPADPLAIFAGAGLFTAAALPSSIPARRGAAAEAMEALR